MQFQPISKFLLAVAATAWMSAPSHAGTVASSTDEARTMAHVADEKGSAGDHRLARAASIYLSKLPGSTDEARERAAAANGEQVQMATRRRSLIEHTRLPSSTDEARELASMRG